MAVCEENLAKDVISGAVRVNNDNTIEKVEVPDKEEDVVDTEIKLTQNASETVVSLLNDSISDYNIYLDKSKTLDDKKFVEDKIKELQLLIAKYTVKK